MESILPRCKEQDERGAILLSVTVLSVFVFAVVLAIAASSGMNSVLTANSRSGLEAFTAAEGGRDALVADLTRGACTATGTVAESATSPGYSWRIFRYRAVGTETPSTLNQTSPAAPVAGCPATDSTHVMIETTGRESRGRVKKIVSTYKWNQAVAAATVSPFSSALASGNNLKMSAPFAILVPTGSTTPADVTINSGDYRCEGNGTGIKVQGSVYLLKGNVTSLYACDTITGNLSVNGTIRTDAYGKSKRVDGNGCATGLVTTDYQTNSFGGTLKQNQSPSACAGLDSLGWVDYNPSVTSPPSGWSVVKLTDTRQCTYNSYNWQNNKVHDIYELVEGYPLHTSSPDRYIAPISTPTIIDASICSTVQLTDFNDGWDLSTDITIVGSNFEVRDQTFKSRTTVPRALNFVIPDRTASTPAKPDCASGQGNMNMLKNTYTGGVSGSPTPAYGLIYNPCGTVQITGDYRGQIYVGNFRDSNVYGGQLVYIPASVPSTGGSSSGGSTAVAAGASPELLSQSEPVG